MNVYIAALPFEGDQEIQSNRDHEKAQEEYVDIVFPIAWDEHTLESSHICIDVR